MTVEEAIKKIKQARSQTKEYIAYQSQFSIGLPKTRETYLKGKIKGYEYALSLLGNVKDKTK